MSVPACLFLCLCLNLGLLLDAAPGHDAVAGRIPEGSLQQLAIDAIAEAQRLRGIAAVGPVAVLPVSRPEVESYVEGRVREPANRDALDLSRRFFVALGALGPGVDLVAAYAAFARDQVAGYYDWERKTLRVADWLPASMQRPTLVHEAVHALQDQRFGLARFTDPSPGCSEPSTAVAGLIEGDAMAVTLDAMSGADPDPRTDRAMAASMARLETMLRWMSWSPGIPAVIRESMLFAYVAGTPLVLSVRAAGGWEAVDALYRRPPLSTEQVLHPDRLLGPSPDHPREVGLPALAPVAGRGWRAVGTDIAGELGTRLALEASLERTRARRAAEGWGGDRFVVLAGSGDDLVAWASVWDSAADAADFADALRSLRPPPAALEVRGDRVLAAWGPTKTSEAVVRAMRARMTVTPVGDVDDWVRRGRSESARNGRTGPGERRGGAATRPPASAAPSSP